MGIFEFPKEEEEEMMMMELRWGFNGGCWWFCCQWSFVLMMKVKLGYGEEGGRKSQGTKEREGFTP
ncbi:MAG: hypothetical protein Q8877_02505 [Sweet potato little leaf phytoplasma]|nr:hypothetical protein [Sweet potato little leaf phytoplasma]